jgi:hypothetical protein
MIETEFKIHLHNQLCQVVDLLLHYYNPCQWVNRQTCRKGNPDCCNNYYYDVKKDGNSCDFFSKNGCTIQTLGCKTWFCTQAFDQLQTKMKRTIKAVEIIGRIHALSSYQPEHFIPETGEFQTDDLLRDFNNG